MGLTQKLGTIPLAIQTDSSNNVGIGGAVDASYKLKVTGTTLTTGAATFSSSVTALKYIANAQATYGTLTYEETFKYASSPAGIWFGNSFNSNNNVGLQLRTSNDGTSVQTMTLTPSGNVGIGTSSPGGALHIVSAATTRYGTSDGPTAGYCYYDYRYNGTIYGYLGQAASIVGGGSNTDMALVSINNLVFGAGGTTERMRITSGGNVGIGMTGRANSKLGIRGVDQTSSNYGIIIDNAVTDTFLVRNDGLFQTGNAANSPYNANISGRSAVIDSSGTLGYTSSTRESKTNIKSINDIFWLNELNPVSFNYRKKEDYTNYTDEYFEETAYGLIADEVEKVNSDFVFYNIDEQGNKKLAGVEYNHFISVLIKGYQELSAKVTALENR